jgi:serine/threonine protein phosphatase PrpC
MLFETASISLQGNRGKNQDRCAVFSNGDCVMLLLADGMGGHPKGEVAAQILMDTGRANFEAVSKPIRDPHDFLDNVLRRTHERIVAYGCNQKPPIDPRATSVAALVQNGKAYWSHTGDSRLYLFRGYKLIQRTRDHSFVEQLRERGLLKKNGRLEQRYRNLVTQCLGGEETRFGTTRGQPTTLSRRDILLLCTDGLWSQISDRELSPQIRHHGSLERMVNALAHSAQQAAAPTSDNITVIALRWLGDRPERPVEQEKVVPEVQGTARKAADKQDQLQDAINHLRAAIEEFEADKD